MGDISNRKEDHINLALQNQHQCQDSNGFDQFQFEPNPMPELELGEVDCSSQFLNQMVSVPLVIGAMTGGCENGHIINQHLCEAAQECQIPMALGSQRAALELNLEQQVRQWIPTGIVLANLGGTQIKQQGVDLALRAVESVEANALVIHLNPLQELVQPGGDRDWRCVLDAIQVCADKLPVEVIVKEVGCGIGGSAVTQLKQAGIGYIELAGRGGTNWASIEIARNTCEKQQKIAQPFVNWGLNTAQALNMARASCPDINLIASGGIRHGLDIARCIRLGANMTAIAQPFLKPATQSTDAVIEKIDIFKQQLRWSMFLTGSQTLQDLQNAKLLS
jgi:isopentenyl-diphosphate delta-isomerase